MKHLSVTIPDSLYKSFVDFFKHMPNVIIEEQKEDIHIPEWHKKIVLDRIKNEKLEDGIPWEVARKKLKTK